MYQLSNLKKAINKLLSENDIDENIAFKISSIVNYDFQINNLVKYQSHPNIKKIITLVEKIIKNEKAIEEFEITEKYFINLKINIESFLKIYENIREVIKIQNSNKIILDYGGPNIGKPLHVGHLRSLNIGRSLYNINSLAGNKVHSDIHMGDWGMPIAQIIGYLEKYDLDIEKLSIDDLEEIYPNASKLYKDDDEFKDYSQSINKKLNENDKDLIKKWKKIKIISTESIKKILNLLNHNFDIWMGESDVNGLIPQLIKDLDKKGKISIDNGAYVSNFKSEPKILITKSDGSYLYLTTDLATVINRLEKNDFDKTLYVVDKRQKLHFEQLFDSLDYFEFEKKEYEHIAFGTINDENGNPFKTREGDTKKLSELFEETCHYINKINPELDEETNKILANTVLTFSDLITNRMTDYKFNLHKFTNISGKTGIYVQYSLVRAKKLITNSLINVDALKIEVSELDQKDINLIKSFSKFENLFSQALDNSEPHHLANYLYELSNEFNSIYQGENILENKNVNVKNNKLKISYLFIQYSTLLMEALGISPVERM
jgi:arginyl-tRNA synthetase